MILYADMPALTEAEANRCWLTAGHVLDIAALDREPAARKFFDNITTGGDHLPFEKPGPFRTSPRLYSLAGCVIARAMWEEVGRERSVRTAATVGHAVAALLPGALAFENLAAFHAVEPWRYVLLHLRFGDTPASTGDSAGTSHGEKPNGG